jgi:type I restriction enzyme M protein
MHSARQLVEFLRSKGYSLQNVGYAAKLRISSEIDMLIHMDSNKFSVHGICADRKNIFDLSKPENHCVFMLLLKLLRKGYAPVCITLEKSWQTGHSPIYLDIMIRSTNDGSVFMFEVKEIAEFSKYANAANESKVKQLCSYAMQEKTTSMASFYSYNFDEGKDYFANIYCAELRHQSLNSDDFYDRWNKVFDENDYIEQNPVFSIKKSIKTYAALRNITEEDTKTLFYQFLTILRLNSISDKPTAFMKMINLFLAKLADEISEDKDFSAKDSTGNAFHLHGMRFQYVEGESTESFMKRLNELYKEGMLRYLKKEVIDYSDTELERIINGSRNAEIMRVLDNLRLKLNLNFAFIDVYDDTTFLENYAVVKEIVKLLENYKLKYETKHQFLGDFFEELLNTSLKQESGQFFTPLPLVDFMVGSLDIESRISAEICGGSRDFVPKAIDYACGAGHFLVSIMDAIQKVLAAWNEDGMTTEQKRKIKQYKEFPYSWADEKHVVGIEKDYRLAKTTKIASFLNGDGDVEIIAGDGINRFDCAEYQQTILHAAEHRNEIFDYVISNPPYSVDGFMLNFRKNRISADSGAFSLLHGEISAKDSAIEVFFVERTEQLLKRGGIAAVILPQSVLSNEKYERMRRFVFANFRILCMLLTADTTFAATTTSPVILFMRKEKMADHEYDILIHQSPKYAAPNGAKLREKEAKFLGYEFSSNRVKSGIKTIENSILQQLSQITKTFIVTGEAAIPSG